MLTSHGSGQLAKGWWGQANTPQGQTAGYIVTKPCRAKDVMVRKRYPKPCTGRSQELALTERAPVFTPFMLCCVVFESCAGRSQELALTERAPAFTPVAMHWSLTRARPHREGTSVAPPSSGSLWCGMLARARTDPGAFACHMLGPAGCAVGSPCCPFVAAFLAEDICFHVPVA